MRLGLGVVTHLAVSKRPVEVCAFTGRRGVGQRHRRGGEGQLRGARHKVSGGGCKDLHRHLRGVGASVDRFRHEGHRVRGVFSWIGGENVVGVGGGALASIPKVPRVARCAIAEVQEVHLQGRTSTQSTLDVGFHFRKHFDVGHVLAAAASIGADRQHGGVRHHVGGGVEVRHSVFFRSLLAVQSGAVSPGVGVSTHALVAKRHFQWVAAFLAEHLHVRDGCGVHFHVVARAVGTAVRAGGVQGHRVHAARIGGRLVEVAGLCTLGHRASVAKVPREGAVGVGALVDERQRERCASGHWRQEICGDFGVDGVVHHGLSGASKRRGGGLDDLDHRGFIVEVAEDVGVCGIFLRTVALAPVQGHHVGKHAAVVQGDLGACACGHVGQVEIGHWGAVHRGFHSGIGRASIGGRDVQTEGEGLVFAFHAQKRPLQGSAFERFAVGQRPSDVVVGRRFIAVRHEVGLPRGASFEGPHGLCDHFRIHFHSHCVRVGASAFRFHGECHRPGHGLETFQIEGVCVGGGVVSIRSRGVAVVPGKRRRALAQLFKRHRQRSTSALNVRGEFGHRARVDRDVSGDRTGTAKAVGRVQRQGVGGRIFRAVLVDVDGVGDGGRSRAVAKRPHVVFRTVHRRRHQGKRRTCLVLLQGHGEEGFRLDAHCSQGGVVTSVGGVGDELNGLGIQETGRIGEHVGRFHVVGGRVVVKHPGVRCRTHAFVGEHGGEGGAPSLRNRKRRVRAGQRPHLHHGFRDARKFVDGLGRHGVGPFHGGVAEVHVRH